MSAKMITFLPDFSKINEVEEGDLLFLQPDPQNEHDPHAIRVFRNAEDASDPDKFLGWIAKSKSMLLPGSLNTDDIFDEVTANGATIVLTHQEMVTSRKGPMSGRLICSSSISTPPRRTAKPRLRPSSF